MVKLQGLKNASGFIITFFLFVKDAQDLGISIELLPLSCSDEVFNVSQFYAVCLLIYDIYLLCFPP